MKKTRFTEAQIMGVLRQMEGGVPAAELCREHGMSSATLYKWRAKYGGMDASLIGEMKAMAEENRRPKRMFADVALTLISWRCRCSAASTVPQDHCIKR